MLMMQQVLSDLFEPNTQNRQEALEQKQDFLLVNQFPTSSLVIV